MVVGFAHVRAAGFFRRLWPFTKPDSRPCELRPPSWRTSHFLLLVQEKVTKENTPSVPRPSLREGFATGGRGFADRPSMACGKSGAIPRAAPRSRAGLIRPPFAAAQRDPKVKSEGAGSRPSPGRRSGECGWRFLAWLLRPGRPRFALPGYLSAAARARRKKARRGARMDARAFAVRPRMACQRTSGAASRSRRLGAGDRGREGVFSLVTFSCTSTAPQERRERRSRPEGRRAGCPQSQKVTPSQGCEGNHTRT